MHTGQVISFIAVLLSFAEGWEYLFQKDMFLMHGCPKLNCKGDKPIPTKCRKSVLYQHGNKMCRKCPENICDANGVPTITSADINREIRTRMDRNSIRKGSYFQKLFKSVSGRQNRIANRAHSSRFAVSNRPSDTQSSHSTVDRTSLPAQSSHFVADTNPLNTQSSQFVVDNTPLNTQSSQFAVDNTPLNTQSSQFVVDNTPLNTQASQLAIDNTPFNSQSSKFGVDKSPLRTQSSNFAVDTWSLPTQSPQFAVNIKPVSHVSSGNSWQVRTELDQFVDPVQKDRSLDLWSQHAEHPPTTNVPERPIDQPIYPDPVQTRFFDRNNPKGTTLEMLLNQLQWALENMSLKSGAVSQIGSENSFI